MTAKILFHSSLPLSLVKFLCSVVLHEVANRQSDRKTNANDYMYLVVEVSNYWLFGGQGAGELSPTVFV